MAFDKCQFSSSSIEDEDVSYFVGGRPVFDSASQPSVLGDQKTRSADCEGIASTRGQPFSFRLPLEDLLLSTTREKENE